MAFTIDDARAYIARVRRQFAKTMPQRPHEYPVREWRPELEADFESFAELLRRAAVVEPWPADSPTPRHHHHHLEVDGWDYRTTGAPVAQTTVVNRARVD